MPLPHTLYNIAVRLTVVVLALVMTLGASAQQPESPQSTPPPERRDKPHITPVQPPTNTTLPPARGTSEEVIKRYLSGDTTSAAEDARRDSLRRAYKRYPLLTDVTIGLNFIDLPLKAFGQDYASVDISATLNMWNRLQPVVEVGVGWGKHNPDDMNYNYRAKASPYFKIGANYNFLFKSEPRYQALLGVRMGYSSFGYDITDVAYNNDYWNEHTTFEITGERSHALWGEVVAGLRVGIWRAWALGWTIRYHGMFSYKRNDNSVPWFVPGYGPRRQNIAFTFSLSYTLPLTSHSAIP